MKKHVLFGLVLMLCCFVTGGVYIVNSIQEVTKKLEQVVSFHQVEFLRQNLEHHIKAVQSDLLLQGTPHTRDFNDTVTLVETMQDAGTICKSCHHSVETSKQLNELNGYVSHYMNLLSRTMTLRANNVRMENARMLAFTHGENLLNKVHSLSIASGEKISKRISKVRNDINSTNNFLIACLVLGPLAIFIITIFFLKRFTGSMDILVKATNALEKGDLNYRIDVPLKDEFHTLANAFNGMATSLKDEQTKFQSIHTLYQTLFESAGDAIMISDLENEAFGRIVSANRAASELYGYSIDELIGMDVAKLVPDGKEQKFLNRIKQALSGEWSHKRDKAKRKGGIEIHVELSMGLLQISDKKLMLFFSRDISEQLQAEEKQHLVNHMTMVGQMAAGLAHEIKNPLAGIKVSLDVLADELDLQTEDKEIFVRIVNEINRMEKLLKNLLNYARPPQPHFDLVDINRLLANSIKNVEVASSSRASFAVHFEEDFAADLPQIEIDSAQIQQIFLNIFLNAIDAMEAEGTITTITRIDGDDCIWIVITDTGKGISDASLEKIFNPFFTTKTKGTGLGLSICKRLIEQHNGSIMVDSNLDSGTSFIITLPLTQKNRE